MCLGTDGCEAAVKGGLLKVRVPLGGMELRAGFPFSSENIASANEIREGTSAPEKLRLLPHGGLSSLVCRLASWSEETVCEGTAFSGQSPWGILEK